MDSHVPDQDHLRDDVPPRMPPILAATPSLVTDAGSKKLTGSASAPRWKKRLLFGFATLSLAASIAWATSPRPQLLRPTEEISRHVDQSIQSVAKQIDQAMDAEIEKNHLKVAEEAEWLTIARRLSLGLIGNGLSLEEIRVLEQIPERERIDWWVEYLLQDRRSSDYLAERWTRATVGTNVGPFLIFRRRKYVDWLADQLQENKPYDVIVRELLESKGSWTDSPQVNFLTATMDDSDKGKPDAIRLAGRTSRAFLAQRIDCLQCHHDYLGKVNFTDNLDGLQQQAQSTSSGDTADASSDSADGESSRTGEQSDFHQLAAFFGGVRMENPFVGMRDSEPNYRVKYLNDEEESAVNPTVPYRRDLLPSEGSTRHRLAVWVTHRENKAFARATVNRMWAILFGRPLVEPIDSIPLGGPFPKAMELLAADFTEHGYDLKRLIKTIVCTKAFRRDSRIDSEQDVATSGSDSLTQSEEQEGDCTENQERFWAIFPLTQLRPEQVAASIHQASRIKAIDESSSVFSQLELFGGVNEFTQAYGDRGDDEFDEQSVTIPQRLLVMNGSYVSERIKHNPIANAATRIAILTSNDRIAVETAYLSVLNRLPTGKELNAFCERIHEKRGAERSQVMSSIFWTLINSTEFQWNH